LNHRTRSLRAFTHFGDDFWRFVSASRNSVPGRQLEREVRPCLRL
jgi:hypothetical protein